MPLGADVQEWIEMKVLENWSKKSPNIKNTTTQSQQRMIKLETASLFGTNLTNEQNTHNNTTNARAHTIHTHAALKRTTHLKQ